MIAIMITHRGGTAFSIMLLFLTRRSMVMILSRLFPQCCRQHWSTRLPLVWNHARSVHAALQVRLSEAQPDLGTPPPDDSSSLIKLQLHLRPDLAQRLIAHYQRSPQETQALVHRLESIDFAPLVQKLWSTQFPCCWSKSRTARAVKSYACFLLDAALQPDVPLSAVSSDMDQLWHCHILQTQKYTQDCVALFVQNRINFGT